MSVGLHELQCIKTEDTELHSSVVQIITLDKFRACRVGGLLRVHSASLSARRFVAGYPLMPADNSDFKKFMTQHTIHAHTGALVAPNLVLTAAHAIIPRDLCSTYIIFGRHIHAEFEPTATSPDITWFEIPKQSTHGETQWARAKSIRAMQQPTYDRPTRTWSGPDWALIELEESITDIAFMPLAAWGVEPPVEGRTGVSRIQVVSHPLGLPRKLSSARKHPLSTMREASLLTDFASGASGSPVLVDGKLWAVISGSARFHLCDRRMKDNRYVIEVEPRAESDAIPQPVTPIDAFREVFETLQP